MEKIESSVLINSLIKVIQSTDTDTNFCILMGAKTIPCYYNDEISCTKCTFSNLDQNLTDTIKILNDNKLSIS